MKFSAQAPQKMPKVNFKIFVLSDSYVGFNFEKTFSVEINKQKEKEPYKIHPDDEKALNKVSLY